MFAEAIEVASEDRLGRLVRQLSEFHRQVPVEGRVRKPRTEVREIAARHKQGIIIEPRRDRRGRLGILFVGHAPDEKRHEFKALQRLLQERKLEFERVFPPMHTGLRREQRVFQELVADFSIEGDIAERRGVRGQSAGNIHAVIGAGPCVAERQHDHTFIGVTLQPPVSGSRDRRAVAVARMRRNDGAGLLPSIGLWGLGQKIVNGPGEFHPTARIPRAR